MKVNVDADVLLSQSIVGSPSSLHFNCRSQLHDVRLIDFLPVALLAVEVAQASQLLRER